MQLTGRVDILDREGNIRSGNFGRLLALHVSLGTLDLKRNHVALERQPTITVIRTDLVYRNPFYNRDSRHAFLLDARRGTRLQLYSNRISRTTNIQAFSLDYTRARTRMHLPFYTSLLANAYKRLQDVLGLWDV